MGPKLYFLRKKTKISCIIIGFRKPYIAQTPFFEWFEKKYLLENKIAHLKTSSKLGHASAYL